MTQRSPHEARSAIAPRAGTPARTRHPRRHPRAAHLIAVDRRIAIGRGANAVELYPIAQATQPMVMTYVRDARLLHTAEMVQPLGPDHRILFPESLIELIHTVRDDGLAVDRMIGMHMSPTPWSALAETLAAAHAKA